MSQNKPSNPFSHGSHNYKVCHILKESGEADDWVVTTAFYSAMKFLEDKLFPGDYTHPRKDYEQQTFKTFSQYTSAFGGFDSGTNKHRIMSDMVNNHIDDEDVVNSYEDLRQACFNARYINYQVGEQRVEMAIEALETIKNYCV